MVAHWKVFLPFFKPFRFLGLVESHCTGHMARRLDKDLRPSRRAQLEIVEGNSVRIATGDSGEIVEHALINGVVQRLQFGAGQVGEEGILKHTWLGDDNKGKSVGREIQEELLTHPLIVPAN